MMSVRMLGICAAALLCLAMSTRDATSKKPGTEAKLPELDKIASDYQRELGLLAVQRLKLYQSYQQAKTAKQRHKIIEDSRRLLLSTMTTRLFTRWYGTRWSFEGHSKQPRHGSIACGYFVTTLLKDLGLKINRVRLAQLASETMIRSINHDRHIKRFRQVTIKQFVDEVRQWGEGIYIVGLDNHTGFILNEKGKVYFIHSSYMAPFSVVREEAISSPILAGSRYRVLGKLFVDDSAILAWLSSNAG